MDMAKMTPMILFDDRCYLCTKFAGAVNFLARGRIAIVGHYSALGEKMRNDILDESALEMFWLIDKKNAYGGRAALLPLTRYVLFSKRDKFKEYKKDNACGKECKTVKSVFVRSSSLLSNSRKITLKSK
ncbi:MAG: hypothetical protein OXC46_11060 [Thaumarchaeota archaeon]|nr:hypothetical protein [Nitrososphaerota archaeon]